MPKRSSSYSKEMKASAKDGHLALVTVSVTTPDGTVSEWQGAVGVPEHRFALWAQAMLAREDCRPLPDLEQLVRERLNSVHPERDAFLGQ